MFIYDMSAHLLSIQDPIYKKDPWHYRLQPRVVWTIWRLVSDSAVTGKVLGEMMTAADYEMCPYDPKYVFENSANTWSLERKGRIGTSLVPRAAYPNFFTDEQLDRAALAADVAVQQQFDSLFFQHRQQQCDSLILAALAVTS